MEGSVYLKARQEWDERYADLVLGKRNWQISADPWTQKPGLYFGLQTARCRWESIWGFKIVVSVKGVLPASGTRHHSVPTTTRGRSSTSNRSFARS